MDTGSGPLNIAFFVQDAIVDGGVEARDCTGGVVKEWRKKNAARGFGVEGSGSRGVLLSVPWLHYPALGVGVRGRREAYK